MGGVCKIRENKIRQYVFDMWYTILSFRQVLLFFCFSVFFVILVFYLFCECFEFGFLVYSYIFGLGFGIFFLGYVGFVL